MRLGDTCCWFGSRAKVGGGGGGGRDVGPSGPSLMLWVEPTNSLDTFIPMLTGALFFIFTAPLLLSFYIQRFCRERESQRAAVLSSLGPDNARDGARNKKKKFIGFFHPYW
jgi:hypothetical protein